MENSTFIPIHSSDMHFEAGKMISAMRLQLLKNKNTAWRTHVEACIEPNAKQAGRVKKLEACGLRKAGSECLLVRDWATGLGHTDTRVKVTIVRMSESGRAWARFLS